MITKYEINGLIKEYLIAKKQRIYWVNRQIIDEKNYSKRIIFWDNTADRYFNDIITYGNCESLNILKTKLLQINENDSDILIINNIIDGKH